MTPTKTILATAIAAALLGATALTASALTGSAAHAQATPAVKTTLIHAGTLLAVPGSPAKARQTVVVRDGKVAEIRDGFATPEQAGAPDARVVDLSNAYVLPGLIDLHVHITRERNARSTLEQVADEPADLALDGAYYAEKTLQAGFTTVRDLGSSHRSALALRTAINEGKVPGPTVYTSGQTVSITAGHGDSNGFNDLVLAALQPNTICDGAEACRKAVREQVKRGVDVIKFTATGGVLSRIAAGTDKQMFDDEIQAIIDTAHLYGKKVAAHAHGTAGINAALRFGVDTIEHGSFQDDESVKLFKQSGAWYVPTLHAGWTTEQMAKQGGILGPEQSAKALAVTPMMYASFARAVKGGVNIAFGTDAGVGKHGDNAREFQLMVENGLPPAQAVVTATVNAAKALGKEAEIGTLEPGKHADIIAVAGDPTRDVTVLMDVGFVMRRGTVHKLGGARQVFVPKE